MVDRLTNLIAIFENKSLDFSKNRAEGDDILGDPAAVRSGSVAVIYAVSIAAFGGTTQYTVTWLIRATGNPLAPAWYWSVAVIIGLTAMFATHESAPRKVGVLPIRTRTERVIVMFPSRISTISVFAEYHRWGAWTLL